MSTSPLDSAFRVLRKERETLNHQRRENAAALHHMVRQAAKQGWPKTRIAKVAGISRQTVHEILRAG